MKQGAKAPIGYSMIRTLDELYRDTIGTDNPITLDEFIKNGKAGKRSIMEYANGNIGLITDIYNFYIKHNRKLFDGYFHALGDVNVYKLTYNNNNLDCLRETFYTKNEVDASIRKTDARRLGENVFFEDIYMSTVKPGKNTPINAIKNLKSGIVDTNFISPKNREVMQSGEYKDVRKFMNTAFGKASLFSPIAYRFILDEIIQGDKVLIPAGSWGSPAIAFAFSSKVREMHIIDVIPDVLTKSNEIFEYIKNPIFDGHKKLVTHCCPSQHIDSRHNFTQVNNDFDVVFFSPPYYDVEQYEGGEQSWQEYDTYEDWLDGYWRGTVEMCFNALKPGGTFSFAIVNYKRNGVIVDISGDMLAIAKDVFGVNESEHFGLRHSRKSGWNDGQSISDKMKDGLVEDVHIIKKLLTS